MTKKIIEAKLNLIKTFDLPSYCGPFPYIGDKNIVRIRDKVKGLIIGVSYEYGNPFWILWEDEFFPKRVHSGDFFWPREQIEYLQKQIEPLQKYLPGKTD